jgi:hypothetical protein
MDRDAHEGDYSPRFSDSHCHTAIVTTDLAFGSNDDPTTRRHDEQGVFGSVAYCRCD